MAEVVRHLGASGDPLEAVQSCFPWPVPVSVHVSQALLQTASEQLDHESHGV